MTFSILHISDLHRDLSDEVANEWLLDSLECDFNRFDEQTPKILRPTLCIVSGDLVHGVGLNATNADDELKRQYSQAEEFLVGLADRFFDGERERVVILPGNHDVCFSDVMKSVAKIEIPIEPEKKTKLVQELFAAKPELRWSWRELCFYKITNSDMYVIDSGTSLRHTTTFIRANVHTNLYQNNSSMYLISLTLVFV